MFGLVKRARYQKSRYNVLLPCPDGGHILFNQMSGMMITMDDDAYAGYSGTPRGALLKMLVDGKFLVPEGYDERDHLRKDWEATTSHTLDKCLTIVPTDRCNLGCVYCYEDKADWRNMTQETQDRVMDFGRVYLRSTPTRTLNVIWFGGEATLNMEAIERLSSFFMAECKSLGVTYTTYLVTNGTTLTPAIIERLGKCGIKKMQITVDGLKDDHDAMRPFLREMRIEDMTEVQIAQRRKVSPAFGMSLSIIGQEDVVRKPQSSFDVIMKNLRALHVQGVRVDLRANVNHRNKEGVKKLKEQLDAEGLTVSHPSGGCVVIYSHPVFESCTGRSESQMTKVEHAVFEQELHPKAERLGYTGITCTANMDFHFVINQRGGITKCWQHATDISREIGTVADLDLAATGTSKKDPLRFSPLDDPECRECHVLPLCMGGCKANNKFDREGYDGEHQMGCETVRYTLPDKVLKMYVDNMNHAPTG